MQIKTTLRDHLTPVRMAKIKTQVTADADKDVAKEEHSSTGRGITNRYKHTGNQSGSSSENWTFHYLRNQLFLSWVYTQKMLQHTTKTHAQHVHSSLIHNSQKLERTQMPFNRGMDSKNVVHLHSGILLSYQKQRLHEIHRQME